VRGGPFRWAPQSLLVAAFVAAPAMADVTKDQCIDANGKAQELRRDGKLSAARAQLRVCSDASCPAMVRDDCVKRLDDLERIQPSIVFDVKDAKGADLIDVRVSIDGQPLADHLDGSALKVDPGVHVFTFEVAGRAPIDEKLLVREGEAGRHEAVVAGAASGASPVTATLPAAQPAAVAVSLPPPPPAPSAAPPASDSGGLGTQKVVGLVVGGLGVAGLAVGGVFGAMAFSQKSQEQSACGSACTAAGRAQALSDRSNGVTDGTVSTVGIAAGGALLVVGAILFFTAPHATEGSATTGMLIVPLVGPGGGGLSMREEF